MHKKRKGGSFSQKANVRKLVNQWQQKAREDSLVLLSFNPEQYYRKEGPGALLYELEDLLYHTSFFLSEEAKAKLVQWGFSEQLLRWFIPLNTILSELDALTASGEITFASEEWVLETIQTHLHAQWWEELGAWRDAFVLAQQTKNPDRTSAGSGAAENALLNAKEDLLDHVMPEDKLKLQEMAEELESNGLEEELARTINALVNSDTTTMFLGSLPEKTTTTLPDEETFLRRFFSLFALLDRHREYLREDVFMREPQHSKASYAAYQTVMVLNVVQGYLEYRRNRDA
jgi:hypothetical protein